MLAAPALPCSAVLLSPPPPGVALLLLLVAVAVGERYRSSRVWYSTCGEALTGYGGSQR